jgi:CubicO group peptidase (beta-lactamase class C family)
MRGSTVVDETRAPMARRARSYQRERPPASGHNLIYGEDNVVSTLDDMHRFTRALETGRLLRPQTLAEALTSGRLPDGSTTGYGFGWEVGLRLGLGYAQHGGAWLGLRTILLRYPKTQFSVVVLANSAEVDARDLSQRIARIYLAPREAPRVGD